MSAPGARLFRAPRSAGTPNSRLRPGGHAHFPLPPARCRRHRGRIRRPRIASRWRAATVAPARKGTRVRVIATGLEGTRPPAANVANRFRVAPAARRCLRARPMSGVANVRCKWWRWPLRFDRQPYPRRPRREWLAWNPGRRVRPGMPGPVRTARERSFVETPPRSQNTSISRGVVAPRRPINCPPRRVRVVVRDSAIGGDHVPRPRYVVSFRIRRPMRSESGVPQPSANGQPRTHSDPIVVVPLPQHPSRWQARGRWPAARRPERGPLWGGAVPCGCPPPDVGRSGHPGPRKLGPLVASEDEGCVAVHEPRITAAPAGIEKRDDRPAGPTGGRAARPRPRGRRRRSPTRRLRTMPNAGRRAKRRFRERASAECGSMTRRPSRVRPRSRVSASSSPRRSPSDSPGRGPGSNGTGIHGKRRRPHRGGHHRLMAEVQGGAERRSWRAGVVCHNGSNPSIHHVGVDVGPRRPRRFGPRTAGSAPAPYGPPCPGRRYVTRSRGNRARSSAASVQPMHCGRCRGRRISFFRRRRR